MSVRLSTSTIIALTKKSSLSCVRLYVEIYFDFIRSIENELSTFELLNILRRQIDDERHIIKGKKLYDSIGDHTSELPNMLNCFSGQP